MTKKTDQSLEIVRGSGNVFADFGHANAVGEQVKAFLAAEIIKAMDAQEMTARQAEGRTGIAASDFSRIRHVKLDRFTIDRLIAILERLDTRIEVQVTVRPHDLAKQRTEPIASVVCGTTTHRSAIPS